MAYYYFLKVVVYQHGQSRISGGFGPLRMIESDGSEVTGSDVIGPEVTGRDVTEVCSLVTLTGHKTFGHVTSGCHVGYAEWYILYYY
jgi:hypothetical protein